MHFGTVLIWTQGLCAVYSDKQVRCKRGYAPIFNIKEMVAFGLEANPNTEFAGADSPVLNAWAQALFTIEDPIATASHTFVADMFAGAGLAVFSLFLAMLVVFLAFFSLTERGYMVLVRLMYVVALLDGGVLAGAGIMAIRAMNSGPRVTIEMSGIDQGSLVSFIGPGMAVLFFGAAMKLMSIGIIGGIVLFPIVGIVLALYSCKASDDFEDLA